MMNGVHCQVSTMISESSARRGFVSHVDLRPSPSVPRSELMTPNCASSMNLQKRPTTTGESIIGRSRSVVMSPPPRRRREMR